MRTLTVYELSDVAERLEDLVAEHGSQKKAAAALGVAESHFSAALNRRRAIESILTALGLEAVTVYVGREP